MIHHIYFLLLWILEEHFCAFQNFLILFSRAFRCIVVLDDSIKALSELILSIQNERVCTMFNEQVKYLLASIISAQMKGGLVVLIFGIHVLLQPLDRRKRTTS